MVLLTLMGTAALTMTELEIKISANDKSAKEAFYIAEAGIEHAWALLKSASFDDVLKGPDGDKNEQADNGRLSFGSSVVFAQGAYNVIVTDNDDGDGDPWADADSTVTITSIGTAATGPSRRIEVLVQKIVLNPTGIKGSVTANGSIETNGHVKIDGRDHDIDGAYILGSGTGTLGISTKGTLKQSGNSLIGGTLSPHDYDPRPDPKSSIIIETGLNAAWERPETPDDVLGLKTGQLKILANSRFNGSQYVTDPCALKYPLSGITYVDLPDGGIWNTTVNNCSKTADFSPADYNKTTGILIVHNDQKNAVLKDTSKGTFKGIIIADRYENINNTIIGAVVTLSSEGLQISRGNGAVLYSRDTVTTALSTGSRGLTSLAWREVFN